MGFLVLASHFSTELYQVDTRAPEHFCTQILISVQRLLLPLVRQKACALVCTSTYVHIFTTNTFSFHCSCTVLGNTFTHSLPCLHINFNFSFNATASTDLHCLCTCALQPEVRTVAGATLSGMVSNKHGGTTKHVCLKSLFSFLLIKTGPSVRLNLKIVG